MGRNASTAKKKPNTKKSSGSRQLYSVHPGVTMVQKWIQDLPEKTGKSLQQWMAHIKKEGPSNDEECRDWLKKTYGFGTNTCWWLAERAQGRGEEDGDPDRYLAAAVKYVDDMYAGPKAGLKPLHDALINESLKLGKDVKICPCTTIVPLYRNHVFAQIKPSTRTRIDFGLALRDMKPKGRLVDTGGFAKKDRITHKIAVSTVDDIDAELRCWLKAAYDLDKE